MTPRAAGAVTALAALAIGAGPAGAQVAAEPADEIWPGAHGDRTGPVSGFGLDLAFPKWDSSGLGELDFASVRLDVHGHWLGPAGAGVYGILPLAWGRVELDRLEFSETDVSLGNIELGGLYAARASPELSLVARGGITLPLAKTPSFGVADLDDFAATLAALNRPTDLVHMAPESSFLRLSASPIYRSGMLVARGDVGVEVPLYSGADDDLLTYGRLNLAIGADTGQVAIVGEMVNLMELEDDNEDGDRLIHFLGATVRFTGGAIQPWVSLLVPLDDEINDQYDFMLALGATGGMR
jgi:hypothetical protein